MGAGVDNKTIFPVTHGAQCKNCNPRAKIWLTPNTACCFRVPGELPLKFVVYLIVWSTARFLVYFRLRSPMRSPVCSVTRHIPQITSEDNFVTRIDLSTVCQARLFTRWVSWGTCCVQQTL